MRHLTRKLLSHVAELAARGAAYDMPVQLWPDAVDVAARHITCGNGVAASFVIVDYPAEVPPAWLNTLTSAVDHADVAVHIDPVDPLVAATRLKKRRARLESSRRYDANKDRLDDPYVEAAAADAAELAGRVATGATRMFTISVYITVHAATVTELDAARSQLRAVAAAAMLDVRPASFRQLPAITSTLPLGVDAVGVKRTVDTEVAAASFPFTSPDAPEAPGGVLYGLNQFTQCPVWWDRWAADNHNSVVVARSGAGKSYFTKTEILRQLFDGVHVTVIDPDGEYVGLAGHVGGNVVDVGSVHMNPLELPSQAGADALTRRVMFVHTLASTMLDAPLTSHETKALDDAVFSAYHAAGITHSARTWQQAAPTLTDVLDCLDAGDGDLAARLAPFISGGLSGLFVGAPHSSPDGHLSVFNLKQLPEELAATGTLLVLDAIWRGLTDDGTKRLVVVDEAWLMLRQGAGEQFLSQLAKSARKRRAGLMTVTQDAEDMLSTQLGRTVIANAATQILLRQAPQSLDTVVHAFRLTDAERELLATARRGEALLLSGDTHVAFHAIASEAEHRLCTTGIEAEQ